MKHRSSGFFLGALGVLAANLVLANPAHAAAPDELQGFVEGTKSLSARFEQVQTDERGREIQKSSGRLDLQRPGRFRWSYEKPYEQLIVCDGETLWLYDPDLRQVTVRPAGATLQGTPAQLLTDRAALERHFRVERTTGADPHLRLLPKSKEGDFTSMELWLAGGVPQRMRFHDQLGGQTEVRFTAVQRNAALDAARFRFVVPKGVDVVQAAEAPELPQTARP
ncbi:MAG TPA: outer membrane lipoprotein chaperone LolA [Candidatus Binatia bacterium]|nr:outer membrane lipoprotein chaperone LolA [Candidatus Binatia bacterium]